MAGLIAEKLGMTRVVQEDGTFVPASVLQVPNATVLQVKTKEKDNVEAIVISTFKKDAKTSRARKQFKISDGESFEKGQELTVSLLEGKEVIQVTGTSKGQGYQGVVKRHGFAGMPGGHGHRYRKAPGSIGCRKPRRTQKGKRLPGQMGVDTITLKKVPVLDIDLKKGLVVLKGPVPGAIGSLVYLTF